MNAKMKRLFCTMVSGMHSRSCWLAYHDEVTPDIRRAGQVVCICTPEVSEVVALQNQSQDPVDTGHNCIESEWSRSVLVLPPDGMTTVPMAVGRRLKRVVGTRDYDE